MIVNVRMLAYQPEETIRPVQLPYREDQINYPDGVLSDVFMWGQNENCDDPAIRSTTCSVSMGDVIELPDGAGNYLILSCGFHKLTDEEYAAYRAADRRDRILTVMDFSHQ